MSTQTLDATSSRLPLWLKLVYTAFMAVLIPVYWANYGPTNFLYFCDTALLITLVAVWVESPLLASMCAVGIIAPQTLWVIDFLSNIVGLPLYETVALLAGEGFPTHLGWLNPA